MNSVDSIKLIKTVRAALHKPSSTLSSGNNDLQYCMELAVKTTDVVWWFGRVRARKLIWMYWDTAKRRT